MKKFVSFVLVLVLALSMSATAFAAEITTESAQTTETTVTYQMVDGYTVVIPEAVAIDSATGKGSAALSAENVIIDFGKTLKVKISGDDYDDAWQLIDGADAQNVVKYNIGTADGGDDIVNNSVVLSSASGDNWNSKVEETLYFSLAEPVEKSGTYTDILTFTVSVE